MDGRRDVPQRPLRIRGLALFILTISLVDAMPANPGSLKQNIMSGDLVSDSGSLGTSGNVMSAMGNPLQSSGQDPKLTPVRGTKDEQCSDKETRVLRLKRELREMMEMIKIQLCELEAALCRSRNAQQKTHQLDAKEMNILSGALCGAQSAFGKATNLNKGQCCPMYASTRGPTYPTTCGPTTCLG